MYTHTYPALSDDPRSFRLVSILPDGAATGDRIRCELQSTRLDEAPSYEALSYTWGDPDFTMPIELDGDQFEVTMNLLLALHRLRSTDTKVVFWIDAICINQADNGERTQQVQQMRHIYANAQRVVIWLGDEGEVSSRVTDLLKNVAAKEQEITRLVEDTQSHDAERRLAGLRFMRLSAAGKPLDKDQQSAGPNLIKRFPEWFPDEEAWELLSKFVENYWWTRIWTIQEFVVAPDAVLVYGDEVISWESVTEAFALMFRYHIWRYLLVTKNDIETLEKTNSIPNRKINTWPSPKPRTGAD